MRASALPPTGPSPQASRRESLGSALLLVAVIALAGEAAIFPVYSPDGLARLVLLGLAALAGVLLRGARRRPPTWAIVVSALLTVRALATAPPLATVVSDPRLLTGVVVIGAASTVPALLPLVRVAHAGQVVAGTLATAAAGYGQVAGSRLFGGDARWAELALLLAASTLVARQVWARGGARLGLAVFVVLVPGTIQVVQQSWTEPLLLVLLVTGAVLIDRGLLVWAAVVFGLALVTEPHAVVLAPLLLLWPPARRWQSRVRGLAVAASSAATVTLPFLMADPARFAECAVGFFCAAEPPPTSLSLWLHVPVWAQLPLLALGLVTSYLLAWRCCPRTGSGFLLAGAVVFTTFGLVGKQTFLGQWWLVAALVVAGLAMVGGPRRPSRQGLGF